MENKNLSIFGYLLNSNVDKDLIALKQGNNTLTHGEFISVIKKIADRLYLLGVRKGDVVTISLPNIMEGLIAFYAVNAVGAIANMVHPSLPNFKLLEIQESTHSKLLIGLNSQKAIGAKIVCDKKDVDNSWTNLLKKEATPINYNMENTISVYLHSGGTTDNPKTIVLSSKQFNGVAIGLKYLFKDGETKGFKALTVLPMFHGFGLGAGMHATLCLGMELVLVPKFDRANTPSLLLSEQINMLLGVPIIYEAILAHPSIQNTSDLSHLKYCFVGGDKTPMDLLSRFNAMLTKKNSQAKLCEGYGLTECVSVCAVNRNEKYRIGSIGLPLENVTLGILGQENTFLESESIGEICISGDTVMDRYLSYDISDCFMEKDGKVWLKTGDYGYRDSEGYYYFVERKKRIVKISGVTVFPSEVELILRTNFNVSNVFVKPISKTNPRLKAFVVLKKDAYVSAEELIEYCSAHLMKWAVPEQIIFLDALPMTPVGKVDKKNKIFN